MRSRVLIDANVVYSRCLTDWISIPAVQAGMYVVLWTEDVLAEARYHLRKDHPDADDGPLTARFDRIRELFADGRVDGYRISDKHHPDEGDWHVVNAAIAGGADYLVTTDKKFARCAAHPDFDHWPFEVHTPDSFLMLVDDSNPVLMREITMYQYAYWMSREGSRRPLSAALAAAGAEQFAQRVAEYIHDRTRL